MMLAILAVADANRFVRHQKDAQYSSLSTSDTSQKVGQAYQHDERNEDHHRDDAANKFDQENHKLAWFYI